MKLTIAVCTYRRFDWLIKCLDQLKKQTLPASDFRIIVVDNSLQPEKSEAFRKGLSGFSNLDYLVTDKAGLSYSRNVALEKCKTPYIAYIDDDALAEPFWAENILRCFDRYGGLAGVVGGPVRPIWEIPKPDWLEGNLCHPLAILDLGDKEFVIQRDDINKWLVGTNLCYDVSALRKTGGFPEHLGRTKDLLLCHEELAVNDAVRDMGYLMVYCPDVLVDHLVQKERISLDWLCKNAFWEAVSHALYKTKKTGDYTLTAPVREELSAALEGLFEGFEPKDSQEEAENERNIFRENGYTAISKYGYARASKPNVAPCVYIVTPCLNSLHFIDQCIDSVLSQAGEFYIRYHLQDGGSTDGTLNRLAEWKEKLDSGQYPLYCKGVVFTFTSTSDNGMYDAISKGFMYMDIPDRAVMTWINSDDYLMPGAIASVHQAFSMSEDVSWIIGPLHSCTEREYLYGSHFYGFPLPIIRAGLCDGFHWQHIQQEGTFWRKLLWDKVGGLDLSFKYAGDWDLWRRFSRHCTPVQTCWPLGCFRRRLDQLSRSNMFNYNLEVDSKVPFSQRQDALNNLMEEKEDIKIQVLISRSDQGYTLKKNKLGPENIPGITWQNCPGFAAELLEYFSEKNMVSVNRSEKAPAPGAETFQPVLSKDLRSKKPSSIKTKWKLSPVPGQPNIYFGSGWHPQESDSEGWWRWCAGQGIVQIEAYKMRKAGLFLTVASVFQKDEISIHLNGKAVFSHTVGMEPREIGPAMLHLKAGTNILLISSKMTSSKLANNSESRSFVIKNVKIELTGSRLPDFRNLIAISRVARLIRKSSLFMPEYYHNQVQELKESNQCPEIHYLLYGAWDNKDPNPLFNSAWYLSKYRDVYTSGENPLCHYMADGWIEGRDPHPEFSTERYLSNYLDVRKNGMNPLQHYLLHGILEGRKIHPST